MKVIVTGGAGFIGSALVRQLVDAGDDVLVIDNLTYAASPASLADLQGRKGYAFLKANICDEPAMAAAFATCQPDAVMHLAAETHVDRSIAAARTFIDTNVIGTLSLLQAARGYLDGAGAAKRDAFRFLHVSTDEVFGSLGPDGAFREGTRYDPRSPYSASKAASDHLVRAWGHTYGLPVLLTNCSNNYGPRQLPEKLIPLMIINGLLGEPLPLYGDGLNVRDWLHVEDHARALMLVLQRGRIGETYAVGGRSERTNIDVVHRVCDLLDQLAPANAGRRTLITPVVDRPGHDRRYAIDPSKIETELGWRAHHGFDDGMEATVRWYLDNEAWWRPLRAAGHGVGRLGLPAQPLS